MKSWIFRDKEMKGSFHWNDPCALCNQWILEGDYFCLIIIPDEIRKRGSKLQNFVAHKEEWDEFIKDLKTDDEIADKLEKIKKAKRKPFTEEELRNINIFKEVCREFGYTIESMSKNKRFIKMKKRKTSFTLIYDIIFDRIDHETRVNEGLFGGMFIGELVAKVRNDMYKKQGVNKRDDYTVKKVIDEAVKMTNEIMGR